MWMGSSYLADHVNAIFTVGKYGIVVGGGENLIQEWVLIEQGEHYCNHLFSDAAVMRVAQL